VNAKTIMPLLDTDKYEVIQGQVFNRKKLKARREEFQKLLLPGYVFNAYANRASRRAAAKEAGYITHGWQMYRAPAGSNRQTVVNR
jgi:hypothetical protein